jgi:cytoskeletal protein CcmA (bactofilin family)
MAFGSRSRSSDDRSTPTAPAPQASGGLTAFIDQGSDFEGKLSFKDTVRIDGHFRGEITSENTLIVGETGRVTANIESEIVIISGEVRGDINAHRQLTLHKTARVYGNLRTTSLVVEEGAYLSGQVKMGANKDKGSKPGKDDAGKDDQKEVKALESDATGQKDPAPGGSAAR